MTSKEYIQGVLYNLKETFKLAKETNNKDLESDCEMQMKSYNQVLKDLEEKEKQDKILERLKLPMLYSERKKLGEEYIEWAKENNVLQNDLTNIITWCFCFKMSEVLENGNNI